jgi:hypothetical protein
MEEKMTPNFEEILDKAFKKNLEGAMYEMKTSKEVTLNIMKEIWNLAIEKAVKEVRINYNYKPIAYTTTSSPDIHSAYVDKKSILKLKV